MKRTKTRGQTGHAPSPFALSSAKQAPLLSCCSGRELEVRSPALQLSVGGKAGDDDLNALLGHQLKCLQSHYPSLPSSKTELMGMEKQTNQLDLDLWAGNHRRPGHSRFSINIG